MRHMRPMRHRHMRQWHTWDMRHWDNETQTHDIRETWGNEPWDTYTNETETHETHKTRDMRYETHEAMRHWDTWGRCMRFNTWDMRYWDKWNTETPEIRDTWETETWDVRHWDTWDSYIWEVFKADVLRLPHYGWKAMILSRVLSVERSYCTDTETEHSETKSVKAVEIL